MNFAGGIYVSLVCAEGFENQVPEAKNARWYHLFWLLVPVVGPLLFVQAVRHRHLVVLRGASRTSLCSIGLQDGPATIEKGWPRSQETEYEAGASGSGPTLKP